MFVGHNPTCSFAFVACSLAFWSDIGSLLMRGDPDITLEFIYKKLCIYSYMFKLQSSSKYSPFDTITYWDGFFSHCSKRFSTLQFWCLLVLLPFLFHVFHIRKTFPFGACFFLKNYLFIFRDRGMEGERKGEKHQCVVASHMPPTGDLACNPATLSFTAHPQSTELYQPGSWGLFHLE